MASSPFNLTTSAANLKRLAIIRLILIISLLAALGYAQYGTASTQTEAIHPAHLSILALFTLLNTLTYWRLQQLWPVTDLEYFGQLLLDIIGLTVLLYFSGGASNPFVSYYLVPITISAALLPWRYTWIISGFSLLAYSLMLFYYHPLPDLQPNAMSHHDMHAQHSGINSAINLHVLGMWLTFALSTVLITYFVVKMAKALREQDKALHINREDDLRDQQILAVATLAAGTAHELGTPLSTMSVLIDEMLIDAQGEAAEDIQLLNQQVENCKKILQGLVSTAEVHHHSEKNKVVFSSYLTQVLDRWQVIRPSNNFQLSIHNTAKDIFLEIDSTLEQAIFNLLNNAAEASDKSIDIQLTRDEKYLRLLIRDYGSGIPLETIEQIGKPFISRKGKNNFGLGLGLFLSHATIERLGGIITVCNHDNGGAIAELQLPFTH